GRRAGPDDRQVGDLRLGGSRPARADHPPRQRQAGDDGTRPASGAHARAAHAVRLLQVSLRPRQPSDAERAARAEERRRRETRAGLPAARHRHRRVHPRRPRLLGGAAAGAVRGRGSRVGHPLSPSVAVFRGRVGGLRVPEDVYQALRRRLSAGPVHPARLRVRAQSHVVHERAADLHQRPLCVRPHRAGAAGGVHGRGGPPFQAAERRTRMGCESLGAHVAYHHDADEIPLMCPFVTRPPAPRGQMPPRRPASNDTEALAMTPIAHRCVALLLGVVLLGSPLAASAATPPPQAPSPEAPIGRMPARLSYVDGEVSFWRPGATDWAPAQLNTALAPGDATYTGNHGNLELQVGARAFVRSWGDTQLGLVNQEPDFLQLKITAGHVSLDLRTVEPGRTVEVDTPAAAFTIEAPGYYRVDVSPERTSFITRRSGRATMTPVGGTAVAIAPSEEV